MKRIIIGGVAGQDGSYLAELLAEKGYRVLGFLKKDEDTSYLARVIKDVVLEDTELVRKEDILRWTRLFGPDEVYNFAAMSFIPAPGTTRTGHSRPTRCWWRPSSRCSRTTALRPVSTRRPPRKSSVTLRRSIC